MPRGEFSFQNKTKTDWIQRHVGPVLFADRDLYNPTTFFKGAKARTVGLQTSRGCAEFGRREREAVRPAPTWLQARLS